MNTSNAMTIVNGTAAGKVRCPVCSKTRQAAAFGPWISPNGVTICFYGTCEKCVNELSVSPPQIQTFIADRIERNLLVWHPELRERLPDDYKPRPEGAGNS